MGLGSQGKAKARKRSVDMSAVSDEVSAADQWQRPPAEGCETHNYTCPLPGGQPTDHLKVRLIQDALTAGLIEFALVYQTRHQNLWWDVVEIDSCHDVDVHLHRYAASTRARIEGDPEHIRDIRRLEDVQSGYEEALTLIEEQWNTYRERWQHG